MSLDGATLSVYGSWGHAFPGLVFESEGPGEGRGRERCRASVRRTTPGGSVVAGLAAPCVCPGPPRCEARERGGLLVCAVWGPGRGRGAARPGF